MTPISLERTTLTWSSGILTLREMAARKPALPPPRTRMRWIIRLPPEIASPDGGRPRSAVLAAGQPPDRVRAWLQAVGPITGHSPSGAGGADAVPVGAPLMALTLRGCSMLLAGRCPPCLPISVLGQAGGGGGW